MKRNHVLMALAFVLVASLSVWAGGAGKGKGDDLAKLKTELNLTDTQVTQLQQKLNELAPMAESVKALHGELKALKGAATPDQAAIQAKQTQLDAAKKEWKEQRKAAFQAVLTAEQWAKYEAMHSGKTKRRAKN